MRRDTYELDIVPDNIWIEKIIYRGIIHFSMITKAMTKNIDAR